jgi:heterokaryon incompatibility protein (HET)
MADRTHLYQHLNPSKRQIRLLELVELDANAYPNELIQVSCQLRVVSLDDFLEFIALSYVWGNPNITKPILLDGEVTYVTANLADFLQSLKENHKQMTEIFVWADALCINQIDAKEKGQQVPLMGQIYSRSALVISWLGPADAITHSAMETFVLISEELRKSAEEAGDYPERFGDHLTRVGWLEQHPHLCHVDVPEVLGKGLDSTRSCPRPASFASLRPETH